MEPSWMRCHESHDVTCHDVTCHDVTCHEGCHDIAALRL
jgi:hypothetical protein